MVEDLSSRPSMTACLPTFLSPIEPKKDLLVHTHTNAHTHLSPMDLLPGTLGVILQAPVRRSLTAATPTPAGTLGVLWQAL